MAMRSIKFNPNFVHPLKVAYYSFYNFWIWGKDRLACDICRRLVSILRSL